MNKLLLLILFLALLITGCNDLKYVGNSNEVRKITSIPGFKISPADAEKITLRTNGPKKTIDDYYRDDKYYYIIDGFTGSKSSNALKNGIKIDGQTGKIIK